MAHTPGPWVWNGDRLECVGGAVIEHDSYEGMWFARYNEEDAANKALIAAAPDMLGALKAISDRYKQENPWRTADMHTTECSCMRCAVDEADAAISKAESA